MSARTPSSPPAIPGYRYLELLGIGGFADVFLYEQIGLGGRKVGVKVLLQGLRADLQEAFEAEASVMAKLSNHPSIVSIYDAGATSDGRAYLVMEFCPPPHLATLVRSKPMALPKALEVMIQVAGAVETAHAAGILHRDIKPANILFTEFHRPALTDFGISASTQQGQQGKAVGVSVPWAPPEQLTADRAMGPSGDVYSLAATLYHVLAGHAPFWSPGGSNDNMSMGQRILTEPLRPVRRDDVPASLDRVLAVAMSKRPEQRYPTALEFARVLQQVQLELHLPQTSADARADVVTSHDDGDDEDAGGTKVSGFVSIDPHASPTGSVVPTDVISGRGMTGSTFDEARPGPGAGSANPGVIHHGFGSAPASGPIEFTGHAPLELREGDTVLGAGIGAHAPTPPGVDAPEAQSHPTVVPAPPTVAGRPAVQRSRRPLAIGLAAVVVLGGGYAVAQSRGTGSTANPSASASASHAKPVDALGQVVPEVTGVTLKPSGSSVTVTWTNPAPQTGDTYLYRLVDPVTPKDYSLATQLMATVPAVPGRTCVEVVLRRSNGRAGNAVAGCVVTP